jgi:hypothetical protein
MKQLSWAREFVFETVLISVCFIEYSDVVEKWGRLFLDILQEINAYSCLKYTSTIYPTE